MKIHLIAIGGSVMSQIAIMLHLKGHVVSGSDDIIFEPALSNLNEYGLIDYPYTWNLDKITPDIDAIILGMHAQIDNIELLKAQQLGLLIYSFPEFIYQETINKLRIIVGGSHGKTTTTAMIIHLLSSCNKECDYLVGAKLLDKKYGISLKQNTEIFVGEGDEYLASKLKPQPKFHFYKPHIAVLTGIAWDHINVFPTFSQYQLQFEIFINTIEKNGILIYNVEDDILKNLVESNQRNDIKKIPYKSFENEINEQDEQIIKINQEQQKVLFFGKHNFQNLSASFEVCKLLGINQHLFLNGIKNFKGVEKRLQLLYENTEYKIYRDFAHSPSKLKATISAVKQRYLNKKIIALYELHTYSSLNENFLIEYANCLNQADEAVVYVSSKALEIKKMQQLSKTLIINSFKNPQLTILTSSLELENFKKNLNLKNSILLLMSSGNFDNVSFLDL